MVDATGQSRITVATFDCKAKKSTSSSSYSMASIASFEESSSSTGSDEKQLLVQVRPNLGVASLNIDMGDALANSASCSPTTTTTSTTSTMQLMLTENEAARLRFEELVSQVKLSWTSCSYYPHTTIVLLF